MLPATRAAALDHAQQCFPRESCGLIVVIDGLECYWPCKNIAPDDRDFVINPIDYAAASGKGSITAIIHSHPNSFPHPTEADLASCEKWGLEWHIVSPHLEASDGTLGRWHSFSPSGYRAPLIGREWSWGVHDCWSLVRDWYGDHGIVLRDFQRPLDPDEFIKQPLFESLFPEAGFAEVPRNEAKPGDAVLMSIRSKGLNHVGVLTKDCNLLHHVQGRLSGVDVYGEGLQKATGKIVRHLDWKGLGPA